MSNRWIDLKTLDVSDNSDLLEHYKDYKLECGGYKTYEEWLEERYSSLKEYYITESYKTLERLGLDSYQSLLWVRNYNTAIGAIPGDLFHTEEGAERVLTYLLETEGN